MKDTQNKSEDAWFSKHEKELIEQARMQALAAAKKVETENARKLRDAHHMHCPKCGNKLKEIQIKSVAVDECPHCKGVYFDAGEIEALFEKSAEDQKSFFRKLAKVIVPGL